jgi:hypothetical protein
MGIDMPLSDRPYPERLQQLAARQFTAGALEGFDPRLGKGVDVQPSPAGDAFDREENALRSADLVAMERRQAVYARCVELADRAELSRRLRLARAA